MDDHNAAPWASYLPSRPDRSWSDGLDAPDAEKENVKEAEESGALSGD